MRLKRWALRLIECVRPRKRTGTTLTPLGEAEQLLGQLEFGSALRRNAAIRISADTIAEHLPRGSETARAFAAIAEFISDRTVIVRDRRGRFQLTMQNGQICVRILEVAPAREGI